MMNPTDEMITNARREDMIRTAEKYQSTQRVSPTRTRRPILAGIGKALSNIGDNLQERYGELQEQPTISARESYQTG